METFTVSIQGGNLIITWQTDSFRQLVAFSTATVVLRQYDAVRPDVTVMKNNRNAKHASL
jgi:hypothetical protein